MEFAKDSRNRTFFAKNGRSRIKFFLINHHIYIITLYISCIIYYNTCEILDVDSHSGHVNVSKAWA